MTTLRLLLIVAVLCSVLECFHGGLVHGKPIMNDDQKVVQLPPPDPKATMSVAEAVANRRSIRSFREGLLSDQDLSELLFAASGITCEQRNLRAAPSAGATYPIDLYVVGIQGTHRYLPETHSLVRINEQDLRSPLASHALGQTSITEASVSFVIVATYGTTTQRYGERGIRFVHMEAGHIAQNIHLQAVALGHGSVPIGAFDDDEVAKLLNLRSDQSALYIIPVGLLP